MKLLRIIFIVSLISYLFSCGRNDKSEIPEKLLKELVLLDSLSFHSEQEDSIKKMHIIEGIKTLAKVDKENSGYGEYSLNFAYNSFIIGNDSLFNLLMNKSRAYSSSTNDFETITRIARYQGYYFLDKGKAEDAYKYFYKSHNIYRSLNDDRNVALTHYLLGESQLDLFQYNSAENNFFNAIYISSETNNKDILQESYYSLGLLYSEVNEYDSALKFFDKSIQQIENDNDILLASNLKASAIVFAKQHNYQKSSELLKKALALKDLQKKNYKLYLGIKDELLSVRTKLGEINPNIENEFIEQYKSEKTIHDTLGIISNRLLLSDYYIKLGNNNLSVNTASEALFLSKKIKSTSLHLKSLRKLIEIDKAKAVEYSRKYISIRDSLNFSNRKIRSDLARIRMQTDEYKSQYENLSTISYLLFVTLLLFTFLTVFVVKNKNQKIKYIQIISDRNKRDSIESVIKVERERLNESRKQVISDISKELHDNILSQLFAIRLNLDSLNTSIEKKDVERRHFHINSIADLEKDLREISHKLRDVKFNNFRSEIEKLLDNYLSAYNIRYHIEDNVMEWHKIDVFVKINIHRIIQEAIVNIVKYSKADNIYITSTKLKNEHVVIIADDGIGFDIDKEKSGIGLKNMQERADEINAELNINTSIGNGTSIEIKLKV